MEQTAESTPSRTLGEPTVVPGRSLRWWLRSNVQLIGLLLTLVAMAIVFASLSPYFFTVRNLLNIGRAISIRGIVAAGLTVVMISGGIDLSISSNMAASGMLVAFLLREGTPASVAVIAGIAFGAIVGLTISFFVTKVGINPLITTLGMLSIVRGMAYVFSGGVAVSFPGNNVFQMLARGRLLGIPISLILWIIVSALCHLMLRYTRLGQYTYAVGGNEDACRVAGVKVDLIKTRLYVLGAVLAGFGGVLLTSLAGAASPTNAMGAELDIIASIVLGGVGLSGGSGSILGTVLGTLVLGFINNGLTMIGMESYWKIVTRGAILMLAVTLDAIRD